MISKAEKNKKEKEMSLYEAAYELFTDKGINETAINDIVKKAGVGKGTFYLYFKDKYDILDKIILDRSSHVLSEAITRTRENQYETFEEEVLSFIEFIIEYLKENKLLLKLMHKNLSWGIIKKAYDDDRYEEISHISAMFERGYENTDLSKSEIRNRLFMIIELTGSVAYSSIIHEEPAAMSDMKESLFEVIRKII